MAVEKSGTLLPVDSKKNPPVFIFNDVDCTVSRDFLKYIFILSITDHLDPPFLSLNVRDIACIAEREYNLLTEESETAKRFIPSPTY